jgi:energy-coupling factor transporter ATP-binding protein EcfA2
MRPLHLTVDGFTSFRAPVDLDFASLDLFAITGPTGAGKSSLIDALTFALYGQVPRVGREYKQLMSHGAERLSVRLDFRMGRETYRIARTLKTSGAPQSRLERLSPSGAAQPVADRVKEIEEQVGRILGLDYEGFTRSVVLPQGQFDAFLKGKPEERRKILVTLLGLDVYERMHALVNRKAADARREAEFLVQQLARDFADASPQVLESLRGELEAAESSAGRAGDDEDALAAALRTAVTLRTARRHGGRPPAAGGGGAGAHPRAARAGGAPPPGAALALGSGAGRSRARGRPGPGPDLGGRTGAHRAGAGPGGARPLRDGPGRGARGRGGRQPRRPSGFGRRDQGGRRRRPAVRARRPRPEAPRPGGARPARPP